MAGTISRGIKAPIIRQGDDIVKIVADSVLTAAQEDGFQLHEKDVICVTEAVVARDELSANTVKGCTIAIQLITIITARKAATMRLFLVIFPFMNFTPLFFLVNIPLIFKLEQLFIVYTFY